MLKTCFWEGMGIGRFIFEFYYFNDDQMNKKTWFEAERINDRGFCGLGARDRDTEKAWLFSVLLTVPIWFSKFEKWVYIHRRFFWNLNSWKILN